MNLHLSFQTRITWDELDDVIQNVCIAMKEMGLIEDRDCGVRRGGSSQKMANPVSPQDIIDTIDANS